LAIRTISPEKISLYRYKKTEILAFLQFWQIRGKEMPEKTVFSEAGAENHRAIFPAAGSAAS